MVCSLEPLPRASEEGREGGGGERREKEEEEEDEEISPQVFTGLLHCQSRRALVGITYDHNIIFYDLETLGKKKQVNCKQNLSQFLSFSFDLFIIIFQLLGYCDEILDMQFLGAGDEKIAVVTNSEHVKIFHRGSLDCQVCVCVGGLCVCVCVCVLKQ